MTSPSLEQCPHVNEHELSFSCISKPQPKNLSENAQKSTKGYAGKIKIGESRSGEVYIGKSCVKSYD